MNYICYQVYVTVPLSLPCRHPGNFFPGLHSLQPTTSLQGWETQCEQPKYLN